MFLILLLLIATPTFADNPSIQKQCENKYKEVASQVADICKGPHVTKKRCQASKKQVDLLIQLCVQDKLTSHTSLDTPLSSKE